MADAVTPHAPPRSPLVQCLTNDVSMDLVANLLTAAGASPAMVHDERESGEMAALADAVVVNTGTPDPPRVAGMHAAAAAARAHGTPWVLDPVAVGATAYRREVVGALLAHRPRVVRANASEVVALADLLGVSPGSTGAGARGVDAADDSLAVVDHAHAVATATGAVVAVSGATDVVVTPGSPEVVRLAGGHPWMPRVSALGCSATALVAAGCAVRDEVDPDADALVQARDGAVAAFRLLADAGERAGRTAAGPGTFRAHLLDEVAALGGIGAYAGDPT